MSAAQIFLSAALPIGRRLAIAGALGLATTVAIAWYFGAYADWTDRHTLTNHLAPDNGKVSSIRVWQVSRPGAIRRVIVTYGEAEWDHGRQYVPEEAWFDLRIGPETRFDTTWGRLHDAVASPTNVVQAVEDARGWPFLALRCWYNPDPPNDAVVHGAISLDYSIVPESPARLLPYYPIWTGLLADSAAFGAIWAIPFCVLVVVRRPWRTRRGHCPRCAYDLRHDYSHGCPECGWNRAEAEPQPRS